VRLISKSMVLCEMFGFLRAVCFTSGGLVNFERFGFLQEVWFPSRGLDCSKGLVYLENFGLL
jgi:hypothetical protein